MQLQNISVIEVVEEAGRLAECGDKAASVQLYRDWLAVNPSPLAHVVLFNLGASLTELGELADAERCYRQALELQPGFLQAIFNLGAVLEKQRRTDQALQVWEKLTALPDEAEGEVRRLLILALNSRGRLLESGRRYREAERELTRSLRVDPEQPNVIHHWVHLRQKQCAWPVFAALPGISRQALLDGTSALAMLDATDDPALQLAAARRYVSEKAGQTFAALADPAGYAHQRLRIGYLSSDFCLHPVSMLIVEMMELHDRNAFEVYGFCWSPDDGSTLRQRVLKALDHHVPIGALSDEQAAQAIREREIDILIDLQGLTAGARINILARKPAPVQIAYLGFPGTSGMPFIDYVLCDEFVLPPESQPYFSEKPLYLPDVFQVCDRRRPVGPTPTRASCALPEQAFVFCAFNNNHKYTPELFDTWVNILQRVPGSVLWLLADNDAVQPNLIRYCHDRGVSPDRLVFAPRALPPDYLARYRLADVFLDCFPFNGGTTANDALWMGVPVVTCPGRTFASRMAGSLLHSLDLDELVATDFAGYEQMAVTLAQDGTRLQQIRSRLIAARDTAPLFRTDTQTRKIEALLQRVAVRRQALQSAAPDPERQAAMAVLQTGVFAPARDDGQRKRFLHVGCGPQAKAGTIALFAGEDWDEVRFGNDQHWAPDIVGTMTDMARVPSGSMDALYSAYNIEHLLPHEVDVALKEFRRVLGPQGFAVITCPDLMSVCRKVVENGLEEPLYFAPGGPIAALDVLYGLRSALAAGQTYMAHRCGFTRTLLDSKLRAAGFESVFVLERPENFDLWAVACKWRVAPEQAQALFARIFLDQKVALT